MPHSAARLRRKTASCLPCVGPRRPAYLSHLSPGSGTVASRDPVGEAEGVMDGLAVADLKGVLAPLNFTAPMAEKPYSYNYDPPPGLPVRNTRGQAHQVQLLDPPALGDRL